VFKLSVNFEEIFSRAHGNFEDQNKVLDPSTIIVNYCIDTYLLHGAESFLRS